MPDHLHLLLWWDVEEKPKLTISRIMQGIKGASARRIISLLQDRLEPMLQPTPSKETNTPKSHKQNLRYRVWQPGFYGFNIYRENKLLQKLDYIHNNPVRAGLTAEPAEYRWSSYHSHRLKS